MRACVLFLALLIPATALAAPQTTLEMVQFGVGNAYRPGGPLAARIKITSDLDEAVTGLIVWEIENGDGDIAEYSREVTIQSRGGQTTSWIYGVLPPMANAITMLDEDWGFRLFELNEGSKVREIASTRLSPRSAQTTPRPIQIVQDQILVVGPNSAGLGGYEPKAGFVKNPALNSTTAVIWGTQSRGLPDSWQGLVPFSTIVWSHPGDTMFSPGELAGRRDVEDALTEWILRGGHLVLLLPATGDPWRLGLNQTALGDLLSDIRAQRIEGVPLAALLPTLSADTELNSPEKTVAIQTFDPDTLSKAWTPLAAIRLNTNQSDEEPAKETEAKSATEILTERLSKKDEDGLGDGSVRPLVWAVRRQHGYGAIDLVGIDVSNPDIQIEQRPRLPQTGVFWRPILGRRATAPSATVLGELKDQKLLLTSNVSANNLGTGALISKQIGLSGAAAQGLLAAMALFIVYWLVAGPGGFAILRNFKIQRHAWLIFVATAASFAILAWLSSRFLRQGDSIIKHVTVLTHIYDATDNESTISQFDVASVWFSAPLPGYGMVEVGIGGDGDSAQNTLDHYSPPPNGSPDRFPDSDRYTVPFASRANYSVPARATSAEFMGRFKGVPQPQNGAWTGTISVAADAPLSLSQDTSAGNIKLSGTLLNESGVDFNRVHIIQIYPLRTPSPRAVPLKPGIPLIPDQLPNYGLYIALDKNWKAGEELNIGSLLYKDGPAPQRTRGRNSLSSAIKQSFVQPYETSSGWGAVSTLTTADQYRYLSMLGIFEALPPPSWILQNQNQQPDTVRFHRMLGQSIDQSRQFSQSCLLIVAFAEDVPSPVAISIDGEESPSTGRVMLQWIHPLRPSNIEMEIDDLAAGSWWQNATRTSATESPQDD